MNDTDMQSMDRTGEQVIPWQLAATPHERLAKGLGVASADGTAESRYAYWRQLGWVQAHPERAPARFAALGLDEPEFISMFGEEKSALAERLGPAPAWFHSACTALASHAASLPRTSANENANQDQNQNESEGEADFLSLVAPLIEHAQNELAERLEALLGREGVPVELMPLASLADTPPEERIWDAVYKTLVLELKVAELNGKLQTQDPEARLAEFVRSLEEPGGRTQLWAEYPVLVRYVVGILDQWVRRSAEVAERWIGDWNLLIASGLLPESPGELLELSVGQGDVHRDGQSVAIATFERAKLVYKPRSLAPEAVVNRLIGWFNERAPAYDLRPLHLLDRGSYGWTEFLAHEPCTDDEQLRGFYWRAGAMLALLHVLWGIDFHRENLIAHGAYPVAIDCEVLCHITETDITGVPGPRNLEPADAFLADSVVRVGLLPVPFVFQDDQSKWQRSDLSALSGAAGQSTPITAPTLVVEDGELRVRNRRGEMEATQNLPSDSSATAFTPEVVDGFETAYRELAQGRDELLAPGELLDWLRGVELRLLLRPTMYYERVLLDSLHPDFMRDAMDRSICLDRLFAKGHVPGMASVAEDEIRQLVTGNIPFFTFRPESPDLVLESGERVPSFLPRVPLACVEQRLRDLSDDDMGRQRHLIELTLACFDPESMPRPSRAPVATSTLALPGELRAVAVRIGETVMRKKLERGGRAGWVFAKNLHDEIWTPGPVGADLYDGLPGIGLFLAALGRATSHPGALRTATQIGDQLVDVVRPILDDAGKSKPAQVEWPVGAFSGAGGILYFLGNLTRLANESRWLPCIASLVAWIERHCPSDPHLDVISGSAGALLALLSVRDLVNVEAAACAAVARLTSSQSASGEHAGGWQSAAAPRPLAGMGHGAGGIALALAQWNAVRPSHGVSHAVASALAFEETLFDDAECNWRDARSEEREFMAGWCHGAPGIALARLALPSSGRCDERLERALQSALRHTGVAGSTFEGAPNDGLCHGDLGNLEILRLASPHLAGAIETNALLRCYRAVLDRSHRDGWRSGDPLGVENPGLMNGLAGMGLSLLSAATWAESEGAANTPSALLLQPLQ
ncbi:type 2 lanthipeptide synthetase LanM family protein [Pendulispora albinea]|uniref:Type 2 lantipeptide synthetase LanM family protein n=1 Tax=Pendulispora albinea TaxID=2741071 RepID=A0ABZ2LPF3_9BACT